MTPPIEAVDVGGSGANDVVSTMLGDHRESHNVIRMRQDAARDISPSNATSLRDPSDIDTTKPRLSPLLPHTSAFGSEPSRGATTIAPPGSLNGYAGPDDFRFSPAADGKKEPSIKPTYPSTRLDYTYDGHRQNPQFSFHDSFPLSGGKDGSSTPTIPVPRVKFTDSAAYWLGMYFFFNLGLTLFNKVVLVSFPFPYVSMNLPGIDTRLTLQTLTGLHALSGCAGCYLALERGAFVRAAERDTN